MPVGIESPVHLIFIGIVALLVLGPRRLPEMARALGRGVREFREAMDLGAAQAGEHPLAVEQPNVTAAVAQQPGAVAQAAPAAAAAASLEQQPGEQASSSASTPPQGDPLAVSFAQAERELADPAPPLPSGDAPDGRAL